MHDCVPDPNGIAYGSRGFERSEHPHETTRDCMPDPNGIAYGSRGYERSEHPRTPNVR